MQTQLKKWGNSLALRIPVYLAKDLNIQENSLVEFPPQEVESKINPQIEERLKSLGYL